MKNAYCIYGKEGIMKDKSPFFAGETRKLLAGLALILVVVGFAAIAEVPSCDEYLWWCMYEWCPTHNDPPFWTQCQTQCMIYWLQ